jgi:hypothetical protein
MGQCTAKPEISMGGSSTLGKSIYEEMRDKKRYDVNLKASCIIRELGKQHQECRISNLSSSGATVRFSGNISIECGAVIVMAISIPNTIMHIPAEAKIMWIKKCPNELISGIKFTAIISDLMIQQLVKKTP